MQSLPDKSQFGIISFGSTAEWMSLDRFKAVIFNYENRTRDRTLREIANFTNDFKGTNILNPIKMAFRAKVAQGVKKRIFMLTDGSVPDSAEMVKIDGKPQTFYSYIKNTCQGTDDVKVFTFGIGDECSKQLVKDSSVVGRGDYSIVGDNDPKSLKIKVVQSLRKASEPALQNCTFDFGSKPKQLGQLWRNEVVRCFKIVTEEEFSEI